MPELDGVLPDIVDERFAALVLDYFAEHNVIVAEGSGARAVLELLAAPQDIRGKTIVLYADTADAAWGYARKLRGCTCHELRVLPTTLALLIELNAFLSSAASQPRLYAAGTSRFVRLISELAVVSGLEAGKVRVERVDLDALRITCGACRATGDYGKSDQLLCRSCGTKLAATHFYSDETHSFWGTVVSARTAHR